MSSMPGAAARFTADIDAKSRGQSAPGLFITPATAAQLPAEDALAAHRRTRQRGQGRANRGGQIWLTLSASGKWSFLPFTKHICSTKKWCRSVQIWTGLPKIGESSKFRSLLPGIGNKKPIHLVSGDRQEGPGISPRPCFCLNSFRSNQLSCQLRSAPPLFNFYCGLQHLRQLRQGTVKRNVHIRSRHHT